MVRGLHGLHDRSLAVHEGMERLTRAVRAWRSPAALASVQRWLSDELGAGRVSMLHELGRDDPF